MAENTNTEREAFEAWFSSDGKWPTSVERNGDCYKLIQAQQAWEAFQAGRASLSLPAAGQEPVASDGWLHENGLLYRLTDERHPCNRDEINVTMADGSRSIEARSRRALELLDRIRAAAPQPAVAAGWVGVKDRLPPLYTEVLIYPRPTAYCCEGEVDTQGQWHYDEYETGFGNHHIKCEVTHWMPIPPAPSTEGESNE